MVGIPNDPWNIKAVLKEFKFPPVNNLGSKPSFLFQEGKVASLSFDCNQIMRIIQTSCNQVMRTFSQWFSDSETYLYSRHYSSFYQGVIRSHFHHSLHIVFHRFPSLPTSPGRLRRPPSPLREEGQRHLAFNFKKTPEGACSDPLLAEERVDGVAGRERSVRTRLGEVMYSASPESAQFLGLIQYRFEPRF